MNKNTTIGVLLAVIVLGGGYLLIKNKQVTPVVNQVSNNNTTTPPTNTTTNPAVVPPAPIAPSAPNVITNATANTSNSTAIVTGQVRPNGAGTVYWFDYGTTMAFGASSTAQAVGSGYTIINTPAYITGLKASTVYYYRLSAKNSLGTVNGSTYSFVTNTNPPPQGSAPVAHTNGSTSVSRTSATVGGQITPNGSSTNYWFEYGTDTNLGGITSIQTLASLTASTTVSEQLDGLQPLTKYYYRVNAQNQYGTVIGSTMNFTTSGPAAAKQPVVDTTSASNVASTTARLNGKVNPGGEDTTFWFEYSSDSLLGMLIGGGTTQQTLKANTNSSTVSANIAGLTRNSTYYYRVVARNSQGTVRGDIVSFKTRP